MSGANSLEDFEAVHSGEEDIEEGCVVLCGEQHVGAFAAVVGEGDAMSVADESAFDKARDPLVVFDNQHVHGGIPLYGSWF